MISKIAIIFFGFVGLSLASFKANLANNEATVLQEIRLNSVRMAEANLHNENLCFFRTMCAVGTQRTVPIMTLAAGIVGFRKILDKVMDDIRDSGINEYNFPSIYRAVASYEVGISTKNLDLCEKLFPCIQTATHLLNEAVTVKHRNSRATCNAVGSLCPGVSIGCALCGVFAPGTCGQQCIVGGIYCGVSSYSCSYKDKED
ncbi:unnamed protein product [Lepeophtheirus salmonis]|uniref:(salmon louse) hypothetical protein n=1 Tax=Lepeophtheirus salmonis TaxID=72036 RepID=A0A0K2T7G0_LEPSM|nr:unnamed protein product [Lepeophtheirus salmonis]CAF3041241.1 unnamed protein product [Lepeophtheirus salmonis]